MGILLENAATLFIKWKYIILLLGLLMKTMPSYCYMNVIMCLIFSF